MAESRRETAGPAAPSAAGWALPAAVIAVILTLVASAVRLAPPSPRPASAPPDQFSAGRARAVLAELVGDSQPHPVGSPANAAVRQRIVANLRASGYAPRVEEGFACHRGDVCSTVENIVAELPGREPGQAVALMAHYDSVPAGPGVADDMAGVAAILEVARLLKAGPPPRHTVLFTLSEGEEAGLLGAEAFVAASPEARQVRAVVNLEARGTSGRSLMFETSPDNGWLAPLYAASVPRPATSSLFAVLYELLPNDTDFTVFRHHGVSGFNFAFIGDQEHYHTAKDDLASLDLGSLQHHGDNALATARALAGADLARQHPGRAVFFDLLGFATVWWPAGWSPGLAVAGLALLLVAALRLRSRGLLPGRALLLGLAAWPLAVVSTLLVALALGFLLNLVGGLRVIWPARPFPAEATFWFLAATVAFAVVGWVRRAGFAPLWVGIWLWWGIAGLFLALTLPGASYLFIVPLLAAGLAGLVLPAGEAGRAIATAVPAVVAGALWFPVLAAMYTGLGAVLPIVVAIAFLVALALSPLLPLVATAGPAWRYGLPALAGFMTAVMAVGVVVTPPFSPDSPRRLNLVYQDDADAHRGRYLIPAVAPLPPPVRQAAAFGQKPDPPTLWSAPFPVYAADAPDLHLPAPELAVLEDVSVGGKRHLRLHLRSLRGAPIGIVAIPRSAGVESLSVAGHEVPATVMAHAGQGRRLPEAPWRILSVLTLPPQGIDIEAVVGTAAPQTWTVLDRTPGLPPVAAPVAQARPDTTVRSQDGDFTLASRTQPV
jgi:hypothetical protein